MGMRDKVVAVAIGVLTAAKLVFDWE